MTCRRALIVTALPVEAQAILSFFEEVHMQSAPTGVSYMTGNRKIFSSPLGEKLKETWTFFYRDANRGRKSGSLPRPGADDP
jgi:hypothetical protein